MRSYKKVEAEMNRMVPGTWYGTIARENLKLHAYHRTVHTVSTYYLYYVLPCERARVVQKNKTKNFSRSSDTLLVLLYQVGASYPRVFVVHDSNARTNAVCHTDLLSFEYLSVAASSSSKPTIVSFSISKVQRLFPSNLI